MATALAQLQQGDWIAVDYAAVQRGDTSIENLTCDHGREMLVVPAGTMPSFCVESVK